MPRVLQINGFEIYIYTHDHAPMHVHIFRGGEEVVINIETVSVRDNRGMKMKDAHRAQEIVADNQEFLASEWKRIKPIP